MSGRIKKLQCSLIRFGFEIAYAASMVINLLKGAESQALVGNDDVMDTINGSMPPGEHKSG